jgi:hypothetical protein
MGGRLRAFWEALGMAVDDSVFWSAYGSAKAVVTATEVRDVWSAPSVVDGYSVGGLAAHLVAATGRLAEVLEADPPDAASSGVRVVGIPEFYGANRIATDDERTAGLHGFLVADANGRADTGPGPVVAAFVGLEPRLRPQLASADGGRLVPVVQVQGGAARLDDYLVTRVVELVVHADDLACSVGLPEIVPSAEVVATVTAAFVDLAVARSGSLPVVRAFARRERADGDVLRVL